VPARSHIRRRGRGVRKEKKRKKKKGAQKKKKTFLRLGNAGRLSRDWRPRPIRARDRSLTNLSVIPTIWGALIPSMISSSSTCGSLPPSCFSTNASMGYAVVGKRGEREGRERGKEGFLRQVRDEEKKRRRESEKIKKRAPKLKTNFFFFFCFT